MNIKLFELYEPDVAIEKAKKEILQAIAWGRPDKESTGYTHQELIQVLGLAALTIKALEDKLTEIA